MSKYIGKGIKKNSIERIYEYIGKGIKKYYMKNEQVYRQNNKEKSIIKKIGIKKIPV